jgi:hypothetical protein
MKNLSILIVIVLLGLTSCKKDLLEKVTPTSQDETSNSFKQMKVGPDFDWKSSKEITLKIEGLNTITPIRETFTVSSLDNKIIFYQALQTMNVSLTTKFVVPNHIKELSVSFGTIKKVYNTQNNNIDFNYLPSNSAE